MGKNKSNAWLRRQQKDPYVLRSKTEGYRSRACYKLLELHDKYSLFKLGMKVVDLGAAPGGWSQVLVEHAGKGNVVSLDILEMPPIEGVSFLQGDFREQSVHDALTKLLNNQQLDWVVSDMAPNFAGNKAIDQPRSIYLAENALDFAKQHLKEGGGYITKLFHGAGFEEYIRDIRSVFKHVIIRKPDSSRPTSKEVYVLARGYNI